MANIANMIHPQPTTYILHEKKASMSGNDFIVKDASGAVIIKADGKVFSFGDKMELTDNNGRLLCTVKQEKMHVHQTFVILSGDGRPIATMRKKKLGIKDEIKVYPGAAEFSMTGKTDSEPILLMKGSITGRNFNLTSASGADLCHSHEKRTNVGFGKDEYEVEIAPNTDVVFIVACLVAMDCMQEN